MRNKVIVGLILGVFALGLAYLLYFNLSFHRTEFLKTNLGTLLTILAAILIAYFLTQQKTDERKLKDKIEDIVNKVAAFATSGEAKFVTPEYNIEAIEVRHKSIDNLIRFLEENKSRVNIGKEIKIIKNQFLAYKEFVSDSPNGENLHANSQHLERFLSQIRTQCDSIILKLY